MSFLGDKIRNLPVVDQYGRRARDKRALQVDALVQENEKLRARVAHLEKGRADIFDQGMIAYASQNRYDKKMGRYPSNPFREEF